MATFLGNLRKRNVSPDSEAVPRQFPPIAIHCIRVSWNWNLIDSECTVSSGSQRA